MIGSEAVPGMSAAGAEISTELTPAVCQGLSSVCSESIELVGFRDNCRMCRQSEGQSLLGGIGCDNVSELTRHFIPQSTYSDLR